MARKTKVVTVCDRHRGDVEAAGTIEIVIDGERRRIDLCAEHLAELRRAVRPWLKPSPSAPAARTRKPAAARRPKRSPDSAAVREWAQANGYELPARGRIPNAVREAYAAKKKK
jgi:hypothetical protein